MSGTYPVEEHTRSDNDGAHVKFAGGLQELDRAKRPHFHLSLSCTGEGNGNPLQCSCLENPKGRGSLVGCCLWGRTESDMAEVT